MDVVRTYYLPIVVIYNMFKLTVNFDVMTLLLHKLNVDLTIS